MKISEIYDRVEQVATEANCKDYNETQDKYVLCIVLLDLSAGENDELVEALESKFEAMEADSKLPSDERVAQEAADISKERAIGFSAACRHVAVFYGVTVADVKSSIAQASIDILDELCG